VESVAPSDSEAAKEIILRVSSQNNLIGPGAKENTMADEITIGELADLADPKLRKIMMRVAKEMEVAVEKTVAHHAEPANFPLPGDPNSVEQIVSAGFSRLQPAQQQFAKAKLLNRAKASKQARRKILGDLAEIDLRSKSPVAEQVDRLAFPTELKTTTQAVKNLTKINQIVSLRPAGLVTQQTTDNLEFRIHRVKCVDETGKDFNPFGDEPGSDEISLAGTSVDESGDTKKVTEFKVADFDDGDVKTFSPPRRFTFFNLREGTEFPKSYFVTLVLAEKDQSGGLADFVNKLLEKIRERVIAYLAAAIGAAIGASGGVVGIVIGAAIGFVVGKVFEFINAVFSDDIFPPKTISVVIPSLTHRFVGGKTDSPEIVTRFVGHNGTYDVTSDWRLFA
jgi:hypothetical protein